MQMPIVPCSTVSILLVPDFKDTLDTWNTDRIPLTPQVQQVYTHHGPPAPGYEIRHYRLTEILTRLFLPAEENGD